MRTRRTLVPVAIAVAVVASLTVHAGAAPAPAWPSKAERVAAARSMQPVRAADSEAGRVAADRARLGLASDAETVARRLDDPAAVERGRIVGTPVTADELAVVRHRLGVQDSSTRVLAEAHDLSPSTFAGQWFDVSVGKVYVAYTDEDPARTARLRSLTDRPESVEVVRMPYTLAALDAAAAKVGSARNGDLGIDGASAQADAGVVQVLVKDPAATDDATIAKRFDLPLDMIVVSKALPVVDDAAVKGGEYVGGCSAGYWGRLYSGQYVMVTAGHCNDYLWSDTNGDGTGTYVAGYSLVTDNQTAYGTDAQSMTDSLGQIGSNQIRRWGTSDYTVTSYDPTSGSYSQLGSFVCHNGYVTRTGPNCGTIDSTNWVIGGQWGFYKTTYNRNGGDSGTTVFGNNGSSYVPLVGIHKGGNPPGSSLIYGFFSHQANVQSALGIWYWL